jgi:hypothetical protein
VTLVVASALVLVVEILAVAATEELRERAEAYESAWKKM